MAKSATKSILLFTLLLIWPEGVAAQSAGSVLPPEPEPFQGTIGRTAATSTPHWSAPVTAPPGAPNVVVVMTDDVGFGTSSTFGGPVPTPNLDRLAEMGARYNRFHTTAICSPSRASLLTGRNHHAVGTGYLANMADGYPGYTGTIPLSAATIARILRDNGFNTAMFGKHHNLPASEASAAGPFTNWPTGLGFDYFYGFLGGANNWQPRIFRGTHLTNGSQVAPGENVDHTLISDAIRWIHNQKAAAPEKPFFLYWASSSMHAPHNAPEDWRLRFRGNFDQGWDEMRKATFARQKSAGIIPANAKLSPRHEEIPAWDSLTPAQRKIQAREMEAAAASLAYQDAQFGRLLDELQRMEELDNTIVFFVQGDNGGSAEAGPNGTLNDLGWIANKIPDDEKTSLAMLDEIGGPMTFSNYSVGWAWAMDTPFQWTKQVASHLGGTRNGLVVGWPENIAAPEKIRPQFAHLNDIVPTILDVTGVKAPTTVDGIAQQRMDGVSLAYTFGDPAAKEQHRVQYFEQLGNRAIYADGWLANTRPMRMPWSDELPSGDVEKDYVWELYNLDRDFSQSKNLAANDPDKLAEMKGLFDQEARANNVYPLNDGFGIRRSMSVRRLDPSQSRRPSEYVYWGKDVSIAGSGAPSFVMFDFSLRAEIVVPGDDTTGVIVANGSHLGGWSFYLDKGRPAVIEAFSHQPDHKYSVVAPTPLEAGAHVVEYSFEFDAPRLFASGEMTILVDGKEVAKGRIEKTLLRPVSNTETFDVGHDGGAQVTDAYSGEGRFPGEIPKVTIEFAPPSFRSQLIMLMDYFLSSLETHGPRAWL